MGNIHIVYIYIYEFVIMEVFQFVVQRVKKGTQERK